MARNLDLTALRAFVTVAESGGVTRAAGLLHLTQSAVSMQIKRLEESLDKPLFTRESRGLRLTTHGDQLLGYGRQMLSLNDEVLARIGEAPFEGELTIGVPHDIVFPHIPHVLQRLALDYPKVKVQLVSSFTEELIPRFQRGEMDLILTTEIGKNAQCETVAVAPLIWLGAPGGTAWKARPVRLAFVEGCLFARAIKDRLTSAGVPWEMAVETQFNQTVDATISADLAIHAALPGTTGENFEEIKTETLPALPQFNINMYIADGAMVGLAQVVGDIIRDRYQSLKAA